MKKIFLLLALIGFVAIGCSENEFENDIPKNIFFGLDKESITISPDGGSVDVIVYSNYKWEISGTSVWCTPSVKTGNANEDGQTVTFSADVAYDDREATFWFRCADEKIKFVVSQKLKEAIIPDADNCLNIPAEGGIAILNYQTNVDCEVIIPEEAQDWITVAPATRGLVSESANLDISENTTYSARTAVIKVVAKDDAELVVEYTINQEQNNAILADENNTFTVPGWGGEVVITYQTNVDCEVIIPEEAQDWITIAPATRGLVTHNTTLNIAANNFNKLRTCVVKVISSNHNELFAEYTITQNPRYCIYYTSSNGKIVEPFSSSSFDATILSNTYKDGVGIIEFNAPITTIGSSAFFDCRSLTSVTIPDGVTTIGSSAFSGCSSLQEFNGKFASEDGRCLIIEGVLNYFARAGITEYTIPNSVTTIGDHAFSGCRSLTSITIPDGVTKIGDYAFFDCSSLKSVTIPDGVTTIGDHAFSACSSLKSVTIPNSVTTIGNSAFSGCSSLTSINIPDGVTEIGSSAFSGCSSLTSVTIPGSVTEIGYAAFSFCSSLQEFNGKFASEDGKCLIIEGVLNTFAPAGITEYTVPNSVTKIGDRAFRYCSSLISITIPNSVTEIGSSAFSGCSSLTNITIPDGVTTIGDGAFSFCSSLTSVTIPKSVTTIGEEAFYACSSLKSVTIPGSVTTIGIYAFQSCSSLTSVTIPDGVTEIGNYAFYGCSSLTSVHCKPTTPPTGGYDIFYENASDRKIYVPAGSVEAYKSASYWKEYASDIVGYDF